MKKATLQFLDTGQLDMMWSMLQLGGISANNSDVDSLIEYVDKIRQALVQKTAGQRSGDPKEYVSFDDLGTYINLLVCEVLTLRVGGWLERMYERSPEISEAINLQP